MQPHVCGRQQQGYAKQYMQELPVTAAARTFVHADSPQGDGLDGNMEHSIRQISMKGFIA